MQPAYHCPGALGDKHEVVRRLVEHEPAGFHERVGVWALAAANGVSQAGNTITYMAVPWFVLTTTGSASRTGLATSMFALATIASGLTIGNLVDHIGFRRSSILSDALSGITVLIIPVLYFLEWLSFWQLLLLIFLGAYFDTPGRTGRGALTPQLAAMGRMPLERANAILRAAGVSGDVILGPALFGALTLVTRPVNVLYLDAATFAASLLIIALLVRAPVASAEVVESGEGPSEGRLDTFLAGFRFIMRDRVIRVILPSAALYSFVLSSYFGVLIPVYVREEFDNPAYFAVLIGTLGGGSLLGTIVYGSFGHRYSRYTTMLVASAASALAIWLFTLPTYFPTDLLAMFVFGFMGGPFNPLVRTLVQTRTPTRMLGRVLNALFTTMAVLGPIGILTSGLAIDALGLQPVLLTAALLISLVPLWFAFAPWPRAAAPAFEG